MKRKGYIDQFLAFMVIFTMFVFMLFLVIGYSNVSRIQHNFDTMGSIVSRMVSTGKTMEQIVDKINSFKLPYFNDITENDIDINCSGSDNKLVFRIWGMYDPPVLNEFNITSTSSAYNEQNSSSCEFTLFLQHN